MKFGATTEKFVLNCTNGESTLRSFAIAYRCRVKKLRKILRSIDIEAIYEKNFDDIDIQQPEYLYNYVEQQLGSPKKTSSRYWFHLTRTKKSNTFEEGLYPLSNVLDTLWDTLESIFDDAEIRSRLRAMRDGNVENDHYNHKKRSEIDQGPFGIVVREAAFHLKDLGHHDYLEFPEIIQDICDGYYKQHNEMIYDEVVQALQPCIVAIKSNHEASNACIMGALYYAYTHANNKPVSGASVIDVNCGGELVPESEIVDISFV